MHQKLTLLGRVGGDAEIRTAQSGDKVATFTVATSESWKKDGEWQEKTTWHRVVTWQAGLVSMLETHGKKGRMVFVEGKMEYRPWEKDGQTHHSAECKVDRDGTIRFTDKLDAA